MKAELDLTEVEELLQEWAFFYRDRRRFESCRSIEHRFKAHSDDFAVEGVAVDSTPKEKERKPDYNMNRAHQTHEALMALPKIQKWAITYWYCYPWLKEGLVLRVMRKWVGQPVNRKVYREQLEIGRFRMYAWLKNG